MAISKEIRQQVRERAKYLCEYCHPSGVMIVYRVDVLWSQLEFYGSK